MRESGMNNLPWGTNQLKRLGKCIQLETEPPLGLPLYDEVMLHYNDVAAETQEAIRSLDWESLLSDRTFEVTSRPKTIDTLRQKLQRDTSTPLPNIQDIAGVRFEAEMTLDEQDAVVNAIVGLFNHDPTTCVRDLRLNPHSGYRAVHIWLRLPTRVEVQVRTHLQGAWANTYESLADILGRDIRYGVLPSEARLSKGVEALQELSATGIAKLEWARNELALRDEDLNTLVSWLELARTTKVELFRKHQIDFEKASSAVENFRQVTQELETDTLNQLRAHRELFDNMRSNGRN